MVKYDQGFEKIFKSTQRELNSVKRILEWAKNLRGSLIFFSFANFSNYVTIAILSENKEKIQITQPASAFFKTIWKNCPKTRLHSSFIILDLS